MIRNNPHKSQAGRKPCDVVLMFKILVPGWMDNQRCDPEIGAKDVLDLLLQNKTRFLR